MHPKATLHLVSLIYCAILVSLNWFQTTTRSSPSGFSQHEVIPVELAVVLSIAVMAVLAVFCVFKVRSRLERGHKVGEGKWIQSYLCFLYALPLLWRQNLTSTSIDVDGTKTIVSGGYGHELSGWVLLYAVLGLLLLQIARRLAEKKTQPQRVSPADLPVASFRV